MFRPQCRYERCLYVALISLYPVECALRKYSLATSWPKTSKPGSKSVAQSACESEHDGLPMTDTCNVVISGVLKTLILQ